MKTIRVKMTPSRMEKLLAGETVKFKAVSVSSDPEIEIQLVLDNTEDAWAKFDKIFEKIMTRVEKVTNDVMDKVDKATKTILK